MDQLEIASHGTKENTVSFHTNFFPVMSQIESTYRNVLSNRTEKQSKKMCATAAVWSFVSLSCLFLTDGHFPFDYSVFPKSVEALKRIAWQWKAATPESKVA